MHKTPGKISRYSNLSSRSGTWIVHDIPGVALTKRPTGWQPVVLGTHPDLDQDAATRSLQVGQASKLLLHSGMMHRAFRTRQQALVALLDLAKVPVADA